MVAPAVEEHFAEHHKSALLLDEMRLATVPVASAIQAIIDITFWASLRREEGHSPKISLAYLPPNSQVSP